MAGLLQTRWIAIAQNNEPIALCRGAPVTRSHTMVVSRWLVIPMAVVSVCVHEIIFMSCVVWMCGCVAEAHP